MLEVSNLKNEIKLKSRGFAGKKARGEIYSQMWDNEGI